jgi:hypothetical protein
VRIAAGTGSVAGAPHPDGDGWVADVVAPAAPGFAVLEARVDGVPLGVRPRVLWQ